MSEALISCELHDYLEVACLYGYRLRLILKNGQIFEGKAVDIISSPEKREYLVIENGQKQQIEPGQIEILQVLTSKAKFSEVIFSL